MLRRLQTRKTWLLITVALAVVCWCCPAAAYQLEVTAWIDGYSQLIIQGSTVQWHNIDYNAPGWEEPYGYQPLPPAPTYLTTAHLATAWYPDWPGGTNGDKWSSQFTGLNLPMAAMDQIVGFTLVSGRENAFISQHPLAANGYTLIVDFDDYDSGGAYWYTVQLNYTPVPIPPAALLLGSGLLGMLAFRRRFNGKN